MGYVRDAEGFRIWEPTRWQRFTRRLLSTRVLVLALVGAVGVAAVSHEIRRGSKASSTELFRLDETAGLMRGVTSVHVATAIVLRNGGLDTTITGQCDFDVAVGNVSVTASVNGVKVAERIVNGTFFIHDPRVQGRPWASEPAKAVDPDSSAAQLVSLDIGDLADVVASMTGVRALSSQQVGGVPTIQLRGSSSFGSTTVFIGDDNFPRRITLTGRASFETGGETSTIDDVFTNVDAPVLIAAPPAAEVQSYQNLSGVLPPD